MDSSRRTSTQRVDPSPSRKFTFHRVESPLRRQNHSRPPLDVKTTTTTTREGGRADNFETKKKKKKKKRRRKKVARREAGSAVQFSRFSALREKRRDRFTNSRRRIAFFVGAFTLERASSPVGCACKPPSLPG